MIFIFVLYQLRNQFVVLGRFRLIGVLAVRTSGYLERRYKSSEPVQTVLWNLRRPCASGWVRFEWARYASQNTISSTHSTVWSLSLIREQGIEFRLHSLLWSVLAGPAMQRKVKCNERWSKAKQAVQSDRSNAYLELTSQEEALKVRVCGIRER